MPAACTHHYLLHAVNCGRFCFWRRQSVVFCLCMKYLWYRWTDLHQIHTEDMFGPSFGRVWRSRSQGTKNGTFWPFQRPACGWFGKRSVASSLVSFFRLTQVSKTTIKDGWINILWQACCPSYHPATRKVWMCESVEGGTGNIIEENSSILSLIQMS